MVVAEGSQVMTTEMLDSVTGEQQTVIIIQPGGSGEQANLVTQSILDGTLSQSALLGQISNLAQLAVKKTPGILTLQSAANLIIWLSAFEFDLTKDLMVKLVKKIKQGHP